MVNWTPAQRSIIRDARGRKYETVLGKIPTEEKRWKCPTCHTVVKETPCPVCNEPRLVEMCPLDHCNCSHDIITKIEYCPICGEAVCPECGSHDVVQISRVTGYLQEVGGWNNGKKQELKDRKRVDVSKEDAIAKAGI